VPAGPPLVAFLVRSFFLDLYRNDAPPFPRLLGLLFDKSEGAFFIPHSRVFFLPDVTRGPLFFACVASHALFPSLFFPSLSSVFFFFFFFFLFFLAAFPHPFPTSFHVERDLV